MLYVVQEFFIRFQKNFKLVKYTDITETTDSMVKNENGKAYKWNNNITENFNKKKLLSV